MELDKPKATDPSESEARRRWFRLAILPLEPELRAFGRRFARSGQVDVEDLIQETFARIIACETWREVENPGAFAFSTLKNLALDAARRDKVVLFETVADIDRLDLRDERPNPETYALARDELRLLREIIEALPTQCRRVFTLRKVYELSPSEIAVRLRLSVSTVEKHLVKGVRICSELMADETRRCRETSLQGSWDAKKNKRATR